MGSSRQGRGAEPGPGAPLPPGNTVLASLALTCASVSCARAKAMRQISQVYLEWVATVKPERPVLRNPRRRKCSSLSSVRDSSFP